VGEPNTVAGMLNGDFVELKLETLLGIELHTWLDAKRFPYDFCKVLQVKVAAPCSGIDTGKLCHG
jgi:hypothetical protein